MSTINRISTRESFKLALTKRKYVPSLIINLAVYTLLNWTGNTAIVYYGPQVGSC